MKGQRRFPSWLTFGIFCLLVILPCSGYGADLSIGNSVSTTGNWTVNGTVTATSFSGDGSGLTNVGGNSSCTPITSLPITITTAGVYCLISNLATNVTSGIAIEIATDDVVINLNGYKLSGLAAGPGTTTFGIYASVRKNITIRNGTVRGFFIGIFLLDPYPYTTSQGYLIEDIRADMNTYEGIDVQGLGSVIRNNQVVSTGGTTHYLNAKGIMVYGPQARVLNNDVIETKGKTFSGEGDGICLEFASGAVLESNRIGNSSLDDPVAYGIMIGSSSNVLVSNNRVTTMDVAVRYNTSTGTGVATGKYRDNLTSGVGTPFMGGTDAGGNN